MLGSDRFLLPDLLNGDDEEGDFDRSLTLVGLTTPVVSILPSFFFSLRRLFLSSGEETTLSTRSFFGPTKSFLTAAVVVVFLVLLLLFEDDVVADAAGDGDGDGDDDDDRSFDDVCSCIIAESFDEGTTSAVMVHEVVSKSGITVCS